MNNHYVVSGRRVVPTQKQTSIAGSIASIVIALTASATGFANDNSVTAEINLLIEQAKSDKNTVVEHRDHAMRRHQVLQQLHRRGHSSSMEVYRAALRKNAQADIAKVHAEYESTFANAKEALKREEANAEENVTIPASIQIPGVSRVVGGHLFFALPVDFDSSVAQASAELLEQKQNLLKNSQTFAEEVALAQSRSNRVAATSGSNLQKSAARLQVSLIQNDQRQYQLLLDQLTRERSRLSDYRDQIDSDAAAKVAEQPWLATTGSGLGSGWRIPVPSHPELVAEILPWAEQKAADETAIQAAQARVDFASYRHELISKLRRRGTASQIESDRVQEELSLAKIDLEIAKEEHKCAVLNQKAIQQTVGEATAQDNASKEPGKVIAMLSQNPAALYAYVQTLNHQRSAQVAVISAEMQEAAAKERVSRLSKIRSSSSSEKGIASRIMKLRVAEANQARAAYERAVIESQISARLATPELQNVMNQHRDLNIDSQWMPAFTACQESKIEIEKLQVARAEIASQLPNTIAQRLQRIYRNGAAYQFELDRAKWQVEAKRGILAQAKVNQKYQEHAQDLLAQLDDSEAPVMWKHFRDVPGEAQELAMQIHLKQETADLGVIAQLAAHKSRMQAKNNAIQRLGKNGHSSVWEREQSAQMQANTATWLQAELARSETTYESAGALTLALLQSNSGEEGPVVAQKN